MMAPACTHRPEHALVTGGGGFLGRYVVEQLLARGDQVTVFARGAYPELVGAGARLIRGDLRDRDAVIRASEDVDVVYHIAAKAGVWGAYADFYAVNVTGTDHVIAACRAHGIRRLVYTSSPSVVFDGTDQEGADERLPYPDHYESPYPETKAIGERHIVAANDDDLLTVSLRPHLIFGPRDNHLLPGLIARARKGMVPQVGQGHNQVDLTYVEDAARAHLLAADALAPGAAPPGSVYFISQDEPVVLWPWIREFLAALDLPPIRLQMSLSVARALGGAAATVYQRLKLKQEPPLTPFLASELAQSHYFDISRAKEELGYKPALTMTEATAQTVAWLRDGGL